MTNDDELHEPPAAEEPQAQESAAEETQQEQPAQESAAEETQQEQPAQEPVAAADEPQVEAPQPSEGETGEGPAAEAAEEEEEGLEEEEEEPTPRVKPEVPGLHLEVDIVPEGGDPLGRGEPEDPYATDPYAEEDEQAAPAEEGEEAEEAPEPIAATAVDLAAGARYFATGKRKTAIARVTLKPGDGSYRVNGRTLEQHVPRSTLQRNVRQPLEAVGLQERTDVIARVHGGGISAQAGALRHGIARALIEADPNLRGELKRRGFLTRDARVKERKKAGLKKARKRPQFSKR